MFLRAKILFAFYEKFTLRFLEKFAFHTKKKLFDYQKCLKDYINESTHGIHGSFKVNKYQIGLVI